jgi:hypothetical protein
MNPNITQPPEVEHLLHQRADLIDGALFDLNLAVLQHADEVATTNQHSHAPRTPNIYHNADHTKGNPTVDEARDRVAFLTGVIEQSQNA